jgi:hypothetical protein
MFRQDVVTDQLVQRWFEKCHSGDTMLRDESRPTWSSYVDNDVLKTVVEQNPRKPIPTPITATSPYISREK